MKKFILHIIGITAAVYYGLPAIIEGIAIDSGRSALIAAILFAFINFAIKPVIKVITLPFNILTLGLFGFLINIGLFWFVASVIDGFSVDSFVAAALGAIVLTVANWIIDKLLK